MVAFNVQVVLNLDRQNIVINPCWDALYMFEIPIDDSFYFKLIWFFVLFIKDDGNIGTCYDFKNNFSIFF